MVSNDELVSGEIGQVGTQFDGLGHVGARIDGEDYFYNGNKLSEFGDPYGLKKLGVENVGVFFTRGILLDVCAAARQGPAAGGICHLAGRAGGVPEEARTWRSEPGDVVLIRTGHGKLWMKDNPAYGAGEPGIGLAAAKFLTDRKVALIGADTWAIEAVPHERRRPVVPGPPVGPHEERGLPSREPRPGRTRRGGVHEFCFVFSPLRLKGATGSPGNPIAIR